MDCMIKHLIWDHLWQEVITFAADALYWIVFIWLWKLGKVYLSDFIPFIEIFILFLKIINFYEKVANCGKSYYFFAVIQMI